MWSAHDRNFWDLCHEIEKEVEKADWKTGGHMVGKEEYYEGSGGGFGEEEAEDEGGWTGGEFVLGAATGTEGAGGPGRGEAGLSRREVLARAAEERIKRQREQKDNEEAGKP